MEKNGFTITPESGSNNGKITVVASSNTTGVSKTETINVSGGGITKTVNLSQKYLNVCQLDFSSDTDNLFNFKVTISSVGENNPPTLDPNNATVVFRTVSQYDFKEVGIGAFNEWASHNVDSYYIIIIYRNIDPSKKVSLNINIEKFSKTRRIDYNGTNHNVWKCFRIIRFFTHNASNNGTREERMLTYEKLAYDLTTGLRNETFDKVRELIFMDNVITKADGDKLRAKSVAGKVNIHVIGQNQQ